MATNTKTSKAKKSTSRAKSSKKKTEPVSTPNTGFSYLFFREASGVLLLCFTIAIFLSLISFKKADLAHIGTPIAISNLIGPVGVYLGNALLFVFGIGAFLINLVLLYVAGALILARNVKWQSVELLGQLLFVVTFAFLCHLIIAPTTLLGHLPGGIIGSLLANLGQAFLGYVGAILFSVAMMIVALLLATPLSVSNISRWCVAKGHNAKEYISHKYQVHKAYREQLAAERERLMQDEIALAEAQAAELAAKENEPLVEDVNYEEHFETEVDDKVQRGISKWLKRNLLKDKANSEPKEDNAEAKIDDRPWTMGDEDQATNRAPAFELNDTSANKVDDAANSSGIEFIPRPENPPANPINIDFGPQIVDSASERKAKRREMLLAEDGTGVLFKPHVAGKFELPPVSYLNFDDQKEPAIDSESLRAMATQIEQCLADFKVEGSVVEICPGPVITMFEFSPAPGVRVSKIANLSDDLAMALSAISVRIVAPIPGKGVVGIEVPNPRREMVFLKEIIADDVFVNNTKAELPLALGVNVEGEGVVADLARMPHLLVAGATGSGKSVAVNTMICSLLYKHTPEDVRFIMVDPKMLEFSVYADIPHLLLPVVTDPKKATMALNWAVNEMERRYQALADLGVRNIKGYNTRVKVLTAQAEIDQAEGLEGTEALKALGIDSDGNPEHVHMPYIVVIIDEFADLMMTAAKDVETAVARLAQKARAAGIHLILATQRPSTDVITGLIKANFPTRFALRVTSKTDSRVILDGNGAENLLGHGDALFVPPGSSTLTRVHGGYVSEEEISRIVDFLKAQGKPEYNEEILVDEEEEDDEIEEMERDEHYEAAVNLVVETGQASISMIQRKLRVGYNRAARMVEMMEKENIVSAADGCKPREVLVSVSPYE